MCQRIFDPIQLDTYVPHFFFAFVFSVLPRSTSFGPDLLILFQCLAFGLLPRVPAVPSITISFSFPKKNECCIGAKSSFLRLFGSFFRQAVNVFAQCCITCLVLHRTPLNAPQDNVKVPKSPCPPTGVTLNTLISLTTVDNPSTQNARSPMSALKAAGLSSRAVKLFLPVLGLYVCLVGP